MQSIDEYSLLVRRAKEFLAEAEDALKKGRFDLSCFFSEQSVQLYLKAVLLKLTGDYPRTHYIRALLSRIMETLPSDKKNRVAEFIRSNRARISELEDAYVMARHSAKTFSEEDARDLIAVAREIIELIEEVVEEK